MDPQAKPPKSLNYQARVKAGLVKPKPRKAMARKPVRIRSVSKAKEATMARYHTWVEWALLLIEAMKCARCGCKRDAQGKHDPHHPYGRSGQNLFRVIPVCRKCHDHIHERPNDSFREGWLQPEYRGLKHDPEHPAPFRLLPGDAILDIRYKSTIHTAGGRAMEKASPTLSRAERVEQQ